jgi:tRNA dimethylallyltransferase
VNFGSRSFPLEDCGSILEVQPELMASDFGNKKPRVLVVAGPTAVGKSDLCLELAKVLGGEIISADSMQVYRGMDIGTAKPSQEDIHLVPHHLIDVCDLRDSFNVVDFFYAASKAIDSVLSRNRVPIIVGGSGFYIRTLLYGPPRGPSSVPEFRAEIEEEMEIHGVEAAYQRLKELDPSYASRITSHDKQKILRALEIISLTGKKVSDHPWGIAKLAPRYDFSCWFLHRPRDVLYKRIDDRCERMVEQGLVEEVEALKDLELNLSACQAIGYRQTLNFLKSSGSSEEEEEYFRVFKQASRRYAKRQFTWFRSEPKFRWLDIELHDLEIAIDIIAQDYNEC